MYKISIVDTESGEVMGECMAEEFALMTASKGDSYIVSQALASESFLKRCRVALEESIKKMGGMASVPNKGLQS